MYLYKIFFSSVVCIALLAGSSAYALKAPSSALRIEDAKSGSLVLGADRAEIEAGEVYRSVVILWGTVDVYGSVDELVLLSGEVKFHPESRVTKSLAIVGGQYEIMPGADVEANKVDFRTASPFWSLLKTSGQLWQNYYDSTVRIIVSVSVILLLWLSSWALFALFPGLCKLTEQWGKDWIVNGLAGVVSMFLTPAVLVLLVLSLLGIFLVPFYLLFLFTVANIAYSVMALWVGHRIWPPKAKKKIQPWGLLLGVICLQVLWNSSWAFLLVVALWIFALGSVMRGMMRALRSR